MAQRLVNLSAHPQVMQQDGKLSRHCNNGSFLPALATALGQLQTPAA
jgi:hypothetical protein